MAMSTVYTRAQFEDFVLNKRPHRSVIAIDFETTGLNPHKGDRAFIMGVATDEEQFAVFAKDMSQAAVIKMFELQDNCIVLAHNAKFEMSFLKLQWDADIKCKILDTEVFARIVYNVHKSYSLQACSERIGLTKYPPMKEWLKKKGSTHANAPKDIVVPYVIQDANLSLQLYHSFTDAIEKYKSIGINLDRVVRLEQVTTKNLFRMEMSGIRINIDYCKQAIEHEQKKADAYRKKFVELTGKDLVNSPKFLKPLFDEHKLQYKSETKVNKKGVEYISYSFDVDALESQPSHPIIDTILEIRYAEKRISTYWENFIKLAVDGTIYPNLSQGGTKTGRLSARDPNVQNWPDESEGSVEFPIRRTFVADPDCMIVSMDYSQMEQRAAADEASDFIAIKAIEEGIDTHKQVADIAAVPRKLAKSVRFAKNYGAGADKLAKLTKASVSVVRTIMDAIDKTAPGIKRYFDELIQYAKITKRGQNWLGRLYHFDIPECQAYKYPNYRIQGGCADIFKIALINCYEVLDANPHNELTKIMLPIHDELVFQIHKDDMYLLPKLQDAMVSAYIPGKHLTMTVGIAKGVNLYDIE